MKEIEFAPLSFDPEDYWDEEGNYDPEKIYNQRMAHRKKMADEAKARKMKEPKKIPMPFIHGADDDDGPLFITEDWYTEVSEKKLSELARDKKMAVIAVMKAKAKLIRYEKKIAALDVTKKKDAKKLAKWNERRKDLILEIDAICKMYNIVEKDLYMGSKKTRRRARIQKKIHKCWKKVKKWFKRNTETILSVAGVVITGICGLISTAILNKG